MLSKTRSMSIVAEVGLQSVQEIASGSGWRIRRCRCNAGPRDKPYSESNDYVSVDFVVSGTFTFRSRAVSSLLAPGFILLTSADQEYECRHDEGIGDICISYQFDKRFFGTRAAALGAESAEPQHAIIPAQSDLLSTFSEAAFVATHDGSSLKPDDAIDLVISTATSPDALGAEKALTDNSPSRLDIERIAYITRYIERNYSEAISLRELAGLVGLSIFHFGRAFNRIMGVPPYRYLLGIRMLAAAKMLATSSRAVTQVSLECGFDDLSEFTRRFKKHFGISPGRFAAVKRSA